MLTIPYSALDIPPRQRSDKQTGLPAHILALADSIEADGLLQPPVVMFTNPGEKGSRYRLVAGWCRTTAMKKLHDENRSFTHASAPVPKDHLPVVILSAQTGLLQLLSAEFVENKVRLNLPWPDECAAVAAIEAERRRINPAATITEMAQELSEKTGQPVVTHRTAISRQLKVAEALKTRPELLKAKGVEDADRILRQEQREKFEAELARRRLRKVAEIKRTWDLRLGDSRKLLLEMPNGEVDLLLSDPPYGVEADKEKYAVGAHRYDDSPAAALDLAIFIIQEGWRLTKPKANLFLFCDWTLYSTLRTACAQYGWTPWHRPLIWQKALREGPAPWGKDGFINTYEMILWATKGEYGLGGRGPVPDITYIQKSGSIGRTHGAEKPVELLAHFIELSTRPGDFVLDPCAGSGSTLLAAAKYNRRSLGIELDEIYYNRAMTRLSDFEQEKTNAQRRPAISLPQEPDPTPSNDGLPALG